MRILLNTIGTFNGNQFSITPVIANDYIPLIAFQTKFLREGLFYYTKPSFEKTLSRPNTLKNIKDGFELGGITRKIRINDRNFYIAKGVFFSEAGVPLMVCAMKKEAFLDESISKYSDYLDGEFSYNNYVLFYSTSFFIDPGLMPLNRRLQKEILQSCYEKGIEVRMLSSLEIEKNTFARLFEVKKTKSLTQLEAYMEQVLPNFLHNEGEDTFVEQEFEPIVLAHEEELSVEDEALLFDNNSTITTITTTLPWDFPAQTIVDARELAELEAEAILYENPINWEEFEAAADLVGPTHIEPTERNLTIHTSAAGRAMFENALRAEVSNSLPHPADSLVERMRPLQDAYNMQMQAHQNFTGPGEARTYIGGIDPYTLDSDNVSVGTVTWRIARREGVIELIDDTE
jgi:hypothetical protein